MQIREFRCVDARRSTRNRNPRLKPVQHRQQIRSNGPGNHDESRHGLRGSVSTSSQRLQGRVFQRCRWCIGEAFVVYYILVHCSQFDILSELDLMLDCFAR